MSKRANIFPQVESQTVRLVPLALCSDLLMSWKEHGSELHQAPHSKKSPQPHELSI